MDPADPSDCDYAFTMRSANISRSSMDTSSHRATLVIHSLLISSLVDTELVRKIIKQDFGLASQTEGTSVPGVFFSIHILGLVSLIFLSAGPSASFVYKVLLYLTVHTCLVFTIREHVENLALHDILCTMGHSSYLGSG